MTEAIEQLPETAEQENAFDEATDIHAKLTLLEVIQAPNIVPMLPEADVSRIGSEALAEYTTDLESCREFRERYGRAMDIATQKTKPKTFPWPGASNVVMPLLTTAATQFQARAYPAIVDGDQVVRCKVLGDDPEGLKADRAERVAAHLNWQFLYDVPGWEEDTDRLLLQLPIVGCVFRKTWYDPVRDQNNSETVNALDFVVNYATPSLDKAPRYTHRQRYYPYEIEALIRSGAWERVPYQGDDGRDPHSLVNIYEQFRLIDMDDDGLPEPYVVTFTEDGHTARIVACFDMDGIYVKSPLQNGQQPLSEVVEQAAQMAEQAQGVIAEQAQVVRIEPKSYFTKYGFIPNPDGSFYDMGFGTLTDHLGAAVNTIINQLIDAGTLSNMQGGFLGGGTKIRGGNMRFTPGEWKRVEGVTSGPLRENILPLQLPGPSQTLFELLGMLTQSVKEITSVSDILTGNQESQTAPTTALALIEQGQKVFTAIYKRIRRALGVEIRSMARLNRDYLDERTYVALQDKKVEIGKSDYQDRDLDIVPVSDPSAINDRLKMARAEFLMTFKGDPFVNQVVIRRRALEAASIDNVNELLDVPPQAPPPDLVAKAEQAKASAHNQNAQAAKALIEAAQAAYALGTTIGDVQVIQHSQALMNDGLMLADAVSKELSGGMNGQPPVPEGGVSGVEGAPDNAGVPAIPEGLPGPDSAAMGAGGGNGHQGAIAG